MALEERGRRSAEECKALARDTIAASLRQDDASFWAHQVAYTYLDTIPDELYVARRALANQTDNWEAWMWYAGVVTRVLRVHQRDRPN